MAERVDTLITNLREVVTMRDPEGDSTGPRRGEAMSRIGVIVDGAIAIRGGDIVAVGPERELCELYDAAETVNGGDRVALPGFVDPHTHLPFSGTRERDFEARILGKSYTEIALEGGGIIVGPFSGPDGSQRLLKAQRISESHFQVGTQFRAILRNSAQFSETPELSSRR